MADSYTAADERLAELIYDAYMAESSSGRYRWQDADMESRGRWSRMAARVRAGAGRLLPEDLQPHPASVAGAIANLMRATDPASPEYEGIRRAYGVALDAAGLTSALPEDTPAARYGYDTAIKVFRDIAARSGSYAARWAADHLTADPDRLAPALPEDTGTEWAYRYTKGAPTTLPVSDEAAARRLAATHGDIIEAVQRWVGPWVPVPTPPEPYRAASIARDGRRPCGECGPGYWIGDEGCQHTELAGPVVGAGMDVAGTPTAGAQTYAPDTQTGPAGAPEEKTR